jgi:hypothetical protein
VVSCTFAEVFTLCTSTTAAVGSALRPWARRVLSRNRSWTRGGCRSGCSPSGSPGREQYLPTTWIRSPLNALALSFDIFDVTGQQLLPVLRWVPAASLVAVQALPWTVVLVVGALVVIGATVSEWQRRRTLVAVLRQAPSGSLVEQERGIGGPRMRIHIGEACPDADQGRE